MHGLQHRTKIKQINLDSPLKNKNVATRNKLATCIQYFVTCTITTNTIVRAMYIVVLKANYLHVLSAHAWNTITQCNSCPVGKQCDLCTSLMSKHIAQLVKSLS